MAMLPVKQKNQVFVGRKSDGSIGMPLIDAEGRLILSADVAVHLSAEGANPDTVGTFGSHSGTPTAIAVDADGHPQVDVLSHPVLVHSTDSVSIYGTDGVLVALDGNGHPQVDIVTVPVQRTVAFTNTGAMAANAAYTPDPVDALAYTSMHFIAGSDVAGTLVVKQGNSTSKMRTVCTIVLEAGTGFEDMGFIDIAGKYVSVTFTNGISAATDVDVQVILNR